MAKIGELKEKDEFKNLSRRESPTNVSIEINSSLNSRSMIISIQSILKHIKKTDVSFPFLKRHQNEGNTHLLFDRSSVFMCARFLKAPSSMKLISLLLRSAFSRYFTWKG